MTKNTCTLPAARVVAMFLVLVGVESVTANGLTGQLKQAFVDPPDTSRPWVYWYWISDNISRDGITRDLETMARVGIGEALIGNVDVNEKSRGPIKVLSEEWWGMVEHAIREGGRLGVKIGMFNCPGWSQSGGPWITADRTMRYITMSETCLRGPMKFEGKLPAPCEIFQDVAVLAFPAPAADTDNIASRKPRLTGHPESKDVALLADGRLDTVCTLPPGSKPFMVDIEIDAPFTARGLVLHPATTPFAVDCELQVAAGSGDFKTVRKVVLDRTNPSPSVGFMAYGPVCVAFGPVTSKHYRVVFSGQKNNGGIAEIELTGAARLESYVEKQLGKMCQTPFPRWDTYLWPKSVEPDLPELAVRPDGVINLTSSMAADGTLRWDVPAGEWVVLRAGMTPTGVKNAPASPEGTGFEVDKMNRRAVAAHFNAYCGKLLERMPAVDRKALRHVVADSYEMGAQNWTDGLAEVFRERYGYDPLLWLPVFTGRIVGSADQSDRFLWDIRRLVADRIATEYVGGLREQCDRHGLRLWLENYGHWGFPGEFLQYGGESHDIGGEFWDSGDLGLIELRAASTAAHIYGKPVVSAEAFTSGGPHWTMDPWWQKRRGDWACTEGINHFVLHVYIHQPAEDFVPGINAPFCTEFNRHNTWFPQAGPWIDYLRRTHGLLQQGYYVADVAYYIGEDTPKMTGGRNPELPAGYSFDYINADTIEHRMKVRDGKLTLPPGMSYRLLVLPDLPVMRPEVLRRIRELVAEGGAVLGPPPSASPSLQGYPACDEQVRAMAAEMWADCDGRKVTQVRHRQGFVFRGVDVKSALATLGVSADVEGLDHKRFPWLHRTSPEGEVYFISHQGDQAATMTPSFRVTELRPELWDAVTGERRLLTDYRFEDGRTVVPLEFAPRQAMFIVFREKADAPTETSRNFLPPTVVSELTGSWTVEFDPRWGGPQSVVFNTLEDWTQRPEEGIRYYSGTASYHKRFDLPDGITGRKLYLDLGTVRNMARVRLNGADLGLAWAFPWRVEVTRAVKPVGNELVVDVINTWANRIIGDLRLPEAKRRTRMTYPHHQPDSPLLPAGLLGPVRLTTE